MSDKGSMIDITEALATVDATLRPLDLSRERLAVTEAEGRIALQDQVSRLDLPAFDKSAMDGYALLEGDDRDAYRLLETVPAGSVPTRKLEPGTATRVMTGAPVPEGTGRVVMQEYTSVNDGVVSVKGADTSLNICRKGEDVRVGDVVLRAPAVLGPLQIANLVGCGVTEIEVARRLRAAVLCTGDEIVNTPEQIAPGKIMNSNGPLLCALCRRHGLEVVIDRTVRDDFQATVDALKQAVERADIVIVSGGVSVGDYDFVGDALVEAGLTRHFDRVATKPGKPMTFASAPGKAVFGLPGNPVSVYLAFHVYVVRAAGLMTGCRAAARHIELPLRGGFTRRKSERLEYVPCQVTVEGDLQQVEFHGSAHLQALSTADGFFAVPRGVTELRAGERVRFMPIRGDLK
jgi:molybdopterin molybdotransferase